MKVVVFVLGLSVFLHLHAGVSSEASCKLKAKFQLSGFKDVDKKKVVIGGMFPVHKSVGSSPDANTSSLPQSSGCEG
nr:vomeronasal type-2 receptor 1-like [Nerophis lumbriciformis]